MTTSQFDSTPALPSVPADAFRALLGTDGTVTPTDTTISPTSLMEEEEAHPATTRTTATPQPATEGEKKPAKKRKSWGQELPTPKTNLPPRKRAKTEDEKEQRRIERVLRNRAAAQSSRERKRKEVEGLEEEKEVIRRQNALLTAQLQQVERENQELSRTVAKMAAEMTVFRTMIQGGVPSPRHTSVSASRQVSPTLSADLLPHVDPVPHLKQELADFDFALPPPRSTATVDPRAASFSSASGAPPLVDADADADVTSSLLPIPDSTQHPAVVLCDLPCRSGWSGAAWERPLPWQPPRPSSTTHPTLAGWTILWTASHLLLATVASAVSSHLTRPLAEIFRSLRTGCPISTATTTTSTEALVPLILWLISTPTNPLSTSSTEGTTPSSRPVHANPTRRPSPPSSLRPTFRTSLLRRLLACSPALARPLRDATGRALRRTSSDERMTDGGFGARTVDGSSSSREGWVPTTAEVDSLRAMLLVLESVVGEQPSSGLDDGGMVRNRDDPSSEVRRVCATLDEMFPGSRRGLMGEMSKILGHGWG